MGRRSRSQRKKRSQAARHAANTARGAGRAVAVVKLTLPEDAQVREIPEARGLQLPAPMRAAPDWHRVALVFSAAAALATWPKPREAQRVTIAPTPPPFAAMPTVVHQEPPAIATTTAAAPKPSNGLAVRVLVDGLARPNAEVSLSDGSRPTLATAFTDREGVARFEGLQPGAYEVWAREGALVSNLARIGELAAQPEIALALVPGSTVRGQLVADALPPSSGTVTLMPVDVDHVMRVAQVDGTGKFLIAGLPFGKWRIEGAASGHVQTGEQILDATAPTSEVAVRMTRTGVVAGIVVDGNGAPVANATIVLRRQGAGLATESARLDARIRWVHPLAGRRVLPPGEHLRFGANRSGNRPVECGQGHCGVDIGSVRGTVIHAAADGEVVVAHLDSHGEAGRYVAVEHGQGVRTYYMHLDEVRPGIEVGLRVRAGDALGAMGDTGLAFGPHLHFSLTQERAGRTWYVDPEPILAHAVVLAQPRALDPIDARDAKLIAAFRREAGPAIDATRSLSTDASGRYRIDGIAPGSYVAVAFSASLAPGTSEPFVIKSGGETPDVRIAMHPGVLVEGRVVGRDGPIAGATVTAGAGSGEGTTKIAATMTNATGDYTLRALSGPIALSVTAPGHGVVERALTLGDAGPRRREDFSLVVENAQLRGQVIAADGGPAVNVMVRVAEGPTKRQVITDKTGKFTIERAALGTYVLEVSGGDFPTMRATTQADRWTEIRMERGGSLHVDLRDAFSSAGLGGIRIEASGPGNRTAAATTDPAGVANLRGLATGEWTLKIRAKGFTAVTRQVSVRAAPDDLRLTLSRSATISGVVRDRRGIRVAGVKVFVDELSTTTDANGNFRLTDAPTGSYWIEAELEGVRGATQVRVDAGDERQDVAIELPQ